MSIGRWGEPNAHEGAPRHDDPLVDRVEQIRLGLADIRSCPRRGESAQPFNGSCRRHTLLRGILRRGQRGSELLQPFEVHLIAEATPDMLKGQLSHLTLDPGAVEGDGSPGSAERRDDAGDDPVVKLDPADLREHGRLPGLVGQACPGAPRLARLGMELAVASVGERPVTAEASAADALPEHSIDSCTHSFMFTPDATAAATVGILVFGEATSPWLQAA